MDVGGSFDGKTKDTFWANRKWMGELGRGAFGIVGKIKRRNGHIQALKLLSIKTKTGPLQAEMGLVDELSSCPLILRYHGLYRIPMPAGIQPMDDWPKPVTEVYGLVQDYLNGESLYDYMNQTPTPRSRNQARALFAHIAMQIGCMHDNGFAHYDVKPENIMYHNGLKGRTWHLIDFGLAETVKRDFRGTTSYISPTKLEGRQLATDQLSDLWALGLTVYLYVSGAGNLLTDDEIEQVSSLEDKQWDDGVALRIQLTRTAVDELVQEDFYPEDPVLQDCIKRLLLEQATTHNSLREMIAELKASPLS